ncbi:MAG: MBL fold metallo-hydrolase [Myxococcaceae bacterium]
MAVALPGAGWVAIDGCEIGEAKILSALVKRFERPGDRVLAFFLTHPHDDHVGGVPELLEEYRPDEVWVTARTPEGPHLVEVTRSRLRSLERQPTSVKLIGRGVWAAMKAISEWELRTGRRVRSGVDGAPVLLPGSQVSARICAPASGAHLDRLFAELEQGERGRANEASLVLELLFGQTRLVFGGDLPRFPTGRTTPVPTGWNATMTHHPDMKTHAFLKVPHHGSAEAHHDDLMAGPGHGRAWAVTPFDSQRLPRLDGSDGVNRLLAWQTPLHLTRPPAAWLVQGAGPSVARAGIRDRAGAQPTGDSFADAGVDIRPPRASTSPFDPVWAFAYDDRGVCRGRWYGRDALAVEQLGGTGGP